MPQKRDPLFVGELVPSKPGRGNNARTGAGLRRQFRQAVAVKEIISDVLRGATRTEAIDKAAKRFSRSTRTLEELYLVNVKEALPEVVEELVLTGKMPDAVERAERLLRSIEANRRRQATARRR